MSVYIVSRDFRQVVNGVTVLYRKGQVLQERTSGPNLVGLLLQNAPIVKVEDESDLAVCPHCQMSFSLSEAREAQAGAAALVERAKKLGVA